MGQLSFFSADLVPPVLDDLGGLLAAHGQITANAAGARLSILVADRPRAQALVAECALRDVEAEIAADLDGTGRSAVRTARCAALAPLAAAWMRGSVKTVPDKLTLTAGFVRLWLIAAGHTDETGYLLGVDPHQPDSTDNTDALIAACSRLGLAGSFIGGRGGGPGIRIVGHRRLARLIDTVGTLPDDLPAAAYPVESNASHPLRAAGG